MSREIEGLENFNRIITLPIGSKFGLFVNSSIDAFNVTGYIDRLARLTDDPYKVSTVMIPTYPLVRFGHTDTHRDLVYEDPGTGLTRVLYERDLKGPLQGIPWSLNRAVILPRYLYDVGAAQCFDACFVFMHLPVGSVVTEHAEQRFTETFFVSANELHNAKL